MLRLEGPPARAGDDRSLGDLLSFIDGSGSGGTAKASGKKKRSKGTRKPPQPAANGHQQVSGLAACDSSRGLFLFSAFRILYSGFLEGCKGWTSWLPIQSLADSMGECLYWVIGKQFNILSANSVVVKCSWGQREDVSVQ